MTQTANINGPRLVAGAVIFFFFVGGSGGVVTGAPSPKALEDDHTRIIVELAVPDLEGLMNNSRGHKVVAPGRGFPPGGHRADRALKDAVHRVARRVLDRLEGMDYRLGHMYDSLPYLALAVSPGVLSRLPSFPEVRDIHLDRAHTLETAPAHPADHRGHRSGPLLHNTIDLVGAANAWAMGYTGRGWYVAVLDTGIHADHGFFRGKTIVEACFSGNGDCPNGETSMVGPGSARHLVSFSGKHDHGTHVTGIAAGNNGEMSGTAKDSNIIAVQVFSFYDTWVCMYFACIASYSSDQVKGLDYIYSLRGTHSIAAVNMSLGGRIYGSHCDDVVQKQAIAGLEAVGIATVISTGNSASCNGVASPSCISPAVAVGASTNDDTEAFFNNWDPELMELFAPGVQVYSALGQSDSEYGYLSGTSMAAPHVTGAWALMKQAVPGAGVTDILDALRTSGVPVDTLCPQGGASPRIKIDDAIALLIKHSPVPNIALDRKGLNFTAVGSGTVTGPQPIRIKNNGGGTLDWNAEADSSWLHLSPTSGTGAGRLWVSVTPDQPVGDYHGTLAVRCPGATNSPRIVDVHLTVRADGQDNPPFGYLDSPVNAAVLKGGVAITGWALDDVETTGVKIFHRPRNLPRNQPPPPGGDPGFYVGDGYFVPGARPDVGAAFPSFPRYDRAGWGYMMVGRLLPDGEHIITATATDNNGQSTTLGSVSVIIDNADGVKPFGTIDSPVPGGTAAGSDYRVQGWVLTPPPAKIPQDGSSIGVYVDGRHLGHATYNIHRSDIETLFPGYANSDGALAYFDLDTTAHDNGLHVIQWVATDDAGNTAGIGCRYFNIENPGTQNDQRFTGFRTGGPPRPVVVVKGYTGGYGGTGTPQRVQPGPGGITGIDLKPLQRLQIHFPGTTAALSTLPAGSTMDVRGGIFYWQPGPGFAGTHRLMFADHKGSWTVRVNFLTTN